MNIKTRDRRKDETWTLAHLVTASILVEAGARPGVEGSVKVFFCEPQIADNGHGIQVYYTLVARGSQDQKIMFTSSGSHHWTGTVLTGAGSGGGTV